MRPSSGMGVAMAGRATPLIRPIRNSALAMVAPVLPALTMARALPSRTASAARTSEESFLRRTDWPGSSSMAMTSEAGRTSSPPVSPIWSGGPTSTTGMPSSSTARRAPATISPGAWSPPMASTATGRPRQTTPRAGAEAVPLVDLDGLAALVPPAVAHTTCGTLAWWHCGQMLRAGRLQHPVRGPPTTALRLGGLLLGDGHRCSPRVRDGPGYPLDPPRRPGGRGHGVGARAPPSARGLALDLALGHRKTSSAPSGDRAVPRTHRAPRCD